MLIYENDPFVLHAAVMRETRWTVVVVVVVGQTLWFSTTVLIILCPLVICSGLYRCCYSFLHVTRSVVFKPHPTPPHRSR